MTFLNYVIRVIKNNRIYLIICLAIFALCFILGLFCCERLTHGFLSENLLDFNIYFDKNVLIKEYFFSKFLSGFALVLLIALSGLIIYTLPLHCIIIAYHALILGCLAVSIFSCYSILGIIVFILIIAPSFLIRIFAIILLSTLNFETIKRSSKCGKFNSGEFVLNFILCLILFIGALIIESLFIAILIRPIYVYF